MGLVCVGLDERLSYEKREMWRANEKSREHCT